MQAVEQKALADAYQAQAVDFLHYCVVQHIWALLAAEGALADMEMIGQIHGVDLAERSLQIMEKQIYMPQEAAAELKLLAEQVEHLALEERAQVFKVEPVAVGTPLLQAAGLAAEMRQAIAKAAAAAAADIMAAAAAADRELGEQVVAADQAIQMAVQLM